MAKEKKTTNEFDMARADIIQAYREHKIKSYEALEMLHELSAAMSGKKKRNEGSEA